MAELIPNALNSDLPNYWKDLSGIDFNVKIDETFYGKTQHYYTTASYEQFKILSEYLWKDFVVRCYTRVLSRTENRF